MDHLQTEARNPASTNLDELTPLELVRLMNTEDAKVIPAVASQELAIAQAIDLIAERLRAGGRLVYCGAGTSGRLGVLDATECPPTFNTPPELVVGLIAGGVTALTRAVEGAEDRPELAVQDLKNLSFSKEDVLVGIATSGRTPYVLGAVAYARSLGATTIGISCTDPSDLSRAVDLAIAPIVGAEVLAGSTRLKAGTATKLVLNMLSTGAMVQLGKTYGNLMVDLRATNTKLRARTNRIVRILTGLSVEDAQVLLDRCQGELKTALVVGKAGVSPEEARQRLAAARGQVREALRSLEAGQAALDASDEQHRGLALGLDGGGSHTVALLARADSGTVLGRGEAGPSNLQVVGSVRALQALDDAVSRAFAAAGLARGTVGTACLGLAGAGRAEDQQFIRDWAQRTGLAERIEVTTDVALVVAAGTTAGWGVAVVAGTGSIVFGKAPDGRTARAGGWGYLLGDEGSGYALALAGLRAVARAADGRGPITTLSERFFQKLGVTEASGLVPAVYRGGLDRPALAALAPIVLETAAAGDAVAREILDHAVTELSCGVVAVADRLRLPLDDLPVCLAGGAFAHAYYADSFAAVLQRLGVTSKSIQFVSEPAVGALRLARQG